ncbi:LacI family DNA-binding transcriptional regulator [Sphingobium sp. CR2-8]|uniref:LacI family DNA-binding transcriptional regulator n=1 Tax=Sphingobium sp. CR2-8 TaxID=1306534 RepID=UPI002DBE6CE4|nr:LacI family DNA-binding transcriptional regulator [Sphingobium sp. CR2-8]MEC3909294.1 LacI family DNA-binding transcriptional regulator [Sphingobium sp. CR2-8]
MPQTGPSHGGNEPTIVDVAAMAGVSIRTVSRVLNQSPKVNRETRARIQVAIDALNFRPSLRARALAKGRSFLIGLVHNDRNALVLDSVQRGVGREATRRGYEVICHSVPVGDPGAADDVLGFARRARVDGLVVMPPVSDMVGLPDALKGDHVPAVAISAVPIRGYGAVLLSRERQAAGDVARHLIGLGHRRIAMITGPQDMISAIERRAGFVEALAEVGAAPAAEMEGDYSLAAGVAAANSLLAASPAPTAIFAANDIMAAGVLKVAAERGIAVPAALSVVGFDGSIVAEMLTPALTTVARPFGAMAEMATRHLIDLIEGAPLSELTSPMLSIVPAQSTAAPG